MKSWGIVKVHRIGKIGIISISGLYNSSDISTTTEAFELPYNVESCIVAAYQDTNRTVFVEASGTSVKLNSLLANNNVFATIPVIFKN